MSSAPSVQIGRIQRNPGSWLPRVALDIGLSPATYYGLSLLGFSPQTSLLGGTVAAAGRVLFGMVRQRRLDSLTSFMLVASAASLALSLVAGDERFLLLRDPLVTALIALIFLGTCFAGRPAMFLVAKRFRAGPADEAVWDERLRGTPEFRRIFTVVTAVWGIGLLVEAAVRAVLVYRLPISAAVALGPVVELAVVGVIVGWNAWYRRSKQLNTMLAELRT